MSYQAIVPLFGMVCYAVLGTMVVRHRPLTRESRYFLGYLVVFILWSSCSFMVRIDVPTGSTYLWNQFLALWALLAAVAYFEFVQVFLRKARHSLWIFLGGLFWLICAFAVARGYVIEEAYISAGTYYIQFGLGFYILTPIAYCFVGAAIFWLAKEFRSTKDPFVRNRVVYLLVGISIVLLLTASNFVPSLARYPIDQLGNVINSLLIGYAILKYRLLDIKIVLHKGSFYTAITGCIVAVYFAVAMLLQTVFNVRTGYATWISALIMAILVAALFHPFYQATQRRLDRLFDRKKYDYRQMLRSSSQAMASIINLDELITWILDRVSLTMGAKKASMLLLDSERQQYYLRACRGCGDLPRGTVCFRHDSSLVKYLNDKNGCLTAEEIDRLQRFRALWKREREVLEKLDAAVLVPLKAQETLIGILILGSKKSDEPYTSDDLDLLSTVANQATTAVRNAELYEKSRQAYKELEEAQEHLIQSERLKALGEMTSGIAHDFNNILTAILGRVQMSLGAIKEGKMEDKKMKRNLGIIEQAARDAAETVRRLQDFARVRINHASEVLDLNEVLRSALEMIRPRLDEQRETLGSSIKVVLKLGKVGPVEGSAAELKESLVNILINAIEAMVRGGKLTVKSERDGDFAVISISDTGVGMTEEVREKVFEPFFTTKDPQGLGMGLSVVYGTISRHKGRISVSSEPGKGSTFTITLPVARKSTEETAMESSQSSIKNATILVVEDDKGCRDVLYEMLTGAGHRVDIANNGKDGLSLARQKDYDLVVADLGMPDISGVDVAAAVKVHNSKTQVVLVTGWGIQLDPAELKEHGVDSVITKPFSKEDILALLGRLLDSRGSAT